MLLAGGAGNAVQAAPPCQAGRLVDGGDLPMCSAPLAFTVGSAHRACSSTEPRRVRKLVGSCELGVCIVCGAVVWWLR